MTSLGGEAPVDTIELRGLRVSAYCGVLPEEVERRQPIEMDLDIHCDLSSAGTSDRLADTIDYGALCEAVERVAAGERFSLLEALAERVASVMLSEDARIRGCLVAVRKLRPPVAQQLATAGVRIMRQRDGAAGQQPR